MPVVSDRTLKRRRLSETDYGNEGRTAERGERRLAKWRAASRLCRMRMPRGVNPRQYPRNYLELNDWCGRGVRVNDVEDTKLGGPVLCVAGVEEIAEKRAAIDVALDKEDAKVRE
ncbi:hypothetical protein KSP40_PGU014528 [Platanthera guangdongensis]|uniref:Uncharacterized protein n=1 Tax=Platanthera guangdongensis TaxID=2320717 RepID=A0ABR2MC10_9ASPA